MVQLTLQDRVVTAGVYIQVGGRVPFVFGPTPAGDRLAVVRVGGHREPGESAWACAAREALEETTLTVEYLMPPATYLANRTLQEPIFEPVAWAPADGPAPLLIIPRDLANPESPVNVMFLARAQSAPQPDQEVCGLLLLTSDEITALCRAPVTLAGFRQAGGHALLQRSVDENLPLEPALQLQLLAALLERGAPGDGSTAAYLWQT